MICHHRNSSLISVTGKKYFWNFYHRIKSKNLQFLSYKKFSQLNYHKMASSSSVPPSSSSSGWQEEIIENKTDEFLQQARKIIPLLADDKHKGQAGRVGVIGGSIEYTGAPYFSAISALKVGADLVHVFCQSAAGPVIKSYSPELIVHPLLDSVTAVKEIEPWLERLHILVIGPGLGREENILKNVTELINICRRIKKPLVIDADGLFLIAQNINIIKNYENVILTPNIIEFSRLFNGGGDSGSDKDKDRILCNIENLGAGISILEKAKNDKVFLSDKKKIFILPSGGSPRRCGGQGDLLSGSLAIFYLWALQSCHPNPALIASFAAGYLTKQCNKRAFEKYGRSAICGDMIAEIHNVFQEFFETK